MIVNTKNKTCVVVGASHAGVNLAFYLRKEGWEGDILLFDGDPNLPYHRPPLSKEYLMSNNGIEKNLIKSEESYAQENIQLNLGVLVKHIDSKKKEIVLDTNKVQNYDKLVFATGASPIIPDIPGLKNATSVFPLRTAEDVENIRLAMIKSTHKRVGIIGGGYVGLEIAATLNKLGASVKIFEREERVLSRVTSPYISEFFTKLHAENEVEILTNKNVVEVKTKNNENTISCEDGYQFDCELVIVGVGVRVNTKLAQSLGLSVNDGIVVNNDMQTDDQNIYAIGDCAYHYNSRYEYNLRLESVQNAIDQAKIAASSICGKEVVYNAIPWFWSDQYDVKLQMVGLSKGYNDLIIREEIGEEKKISLWYFDNHRLLAVDAINNAKAYVIGTKIIKEGKRIDKIKLQDVSLDLKPTVILAN